VTQQLIPLPNAGDRVRSRHLVAGLLGWYLSRRITRPCCRFRARRRDRPRQLDVNLQDVRGGGEVGTLPTASGNASRLSMPSVRSELPQSVSHELRTPLTAIRVTSTLYVRGREIRGPRRPLDVTGRRARADSDSSATSSTGQA